MSETNLIFPHQLFDNNPLFEFGTNFVLVEEHLFFRQYKFHKQKIAFHRASMKSYAAFLQERGFTVTYIESNEPESDIRQLISQIAQEKIKKINFIDPTDDWLNKRLLRAADHHKIELNVLESPMFLNSKTENSKFFRPSKKKYFQTSFYKSERIKRNILVDKNDNPAGGKWTFDAENRKKYPKKKDPPIQEKIRETDFHKEARDYTDIHFIKNYGEIEHVIYPIDHAGAKRWLNQFLETRFFEFGAYEDAILTKEYFLHHSVLSPLMNVGLLTPEYILDETLKFANHHEIPINSLEGFIRQIMGWREFIRGVYECKGTEERTKNFWGFHKKIPASFWNGTTGLFPVDQTIKKVLKTGYCHHIERLMVLGNIMLLCEFDPDEVYLWFMEMFIDAYDWVMVPNIYGMSQFADGGLMSTKPYISGSNYLMKMSDYPKGEWQKTWDGLFWRFMDKHRKFFLSNPRLGMLVHNFDRMSIEKQEMHLQAADEFLVLLD